MTNLVLRSRLAEFSVPVHLILTIWIGFPVCLLVSRLISITLIPYLSKCPVSWQTLTDVSTPFTKTVSSQYPFGKCFTPRPKDSAGNSARSKTRSSWQLVWIATPPFAREYAKSILTHGQYRCISCKIRRDVANSGAPSMLSIIKILSISDSTDSPDRLPILLSISVFSLYSSCSPLLVFLAVD